MTLDEKTNDILHDTNPFEETSEIAQAFDRLDSTGTDTEGLNKIDMNARLNRDEIRMCLIIDELTRLGILEGNTLTKMFKRLTVSQNGLGREEKVRLFNGSTDIKRSSWNPMQLFQKRE